MQNFTASYLKKFGKEIEDNLGNPIQTIEYSIKVLPLKYHKPSLSFNILSKNLENKKAPIISILYNMKEVESLGFMVVNVPLSREQTWMKGQRSMVILLRNGAILQDGMKKFMKLPNDGSDRHHVEYDEANLLIRLTGRKASPSGVGEWISIEEKDL